MKSSATTVDHGDAPSQASAARPSRAFPDIPFHPLLFALYPVLFLMAWNIQEIYLFQTVRSLLASLVVWSAVWGVVALLVRDVRKAALLTSLAILAFFSYGHLYRAIEDLTIAGANLGRHRYLVPAVGLILVVGSVWILRSRGTYRDLTRAANVLGLVLVLLPTVSIVRYLTRPEASVDDQTTRMPEVRLVRSGDEPPPDIIYIILDGYARSDYMTEAVGYDNHAFIDFLESEGFYVVERARSNHNHTALSLAASLNMTPAQFLGVRMVKGDYPEPFAEPIRNSLVRRSLEAIGYDTISLRSGYRLTEFPDADVYLTPDERRASLGARPNAFEDTLARTTLLEPLLETGLLDLTTETSIVGGAGTSHRDLVLTDYDYLENLPVTGSPRFVFSHIVAMHAPFVFDRNGDPLDTPQAETLLEEDETTPLNALRYREQAAFISDRTERMIRALLENEETPPVVIIQADHGAGVVPGVDQRAAILNAILIKDECRDMLYPTMTPVNTFRVVFNCYFDAGLELTEDNAYVSPWPRYAEYEFKLLPPEADSP